MKKTAGFILVVCFVLSTLQACQKGDKGDPGAPGQPGQPGAPGAPGNANVMYSAWFTPSAYVKDTVFQIWEFSYTQAAPEITQEILDSGAIITYARLKGYNPLAWPTGQVSALPVQLTYQQGSVMTDTWSAVATPGNLRIKFVNDKNFYSALNNNHEFRFIIIPGGSEAALGVVPGINTGSVSVQDANSDAKMLYSEVCRKLKIPE